MKIMTGSWFTPAPSTHIKIGISRGVPRGQSAGFRLFKKLAPGDWFRSVDAPEYLRRFNDEILGPLDPEQTAKEILDLAGERIPVMCCYESPTKIDRGQDWCHRHMVAKWFEDRLGIEVEELGYRRMTRFGALENQGLVVSYK